MIPNVIIIDHLTTIDDTRKDQCVGDSTAEESPFSDSAIAESTFSDSCDIESELSDRIDDWAVEDTDLVTKTTYDKCVVDYIEGEVLDFHWITNKRQVVHRTFSNNIRQIMGSL